MSRLLTAALIAGLLVSSSVLGAANWVVELDQRVAAIDSETPGTLGVYVRSLRDGQTYSREANRPWYLSSTVKVHVGIALLQKVEEGVHSLDDEYTLQETDFVDGAGDLLWHDPGSRHTLGSLLRRMLVDSDSTATDILIRLIGEDELNRQIRTRISPDGFNPFTTILQVRYDAYSEIHPNALGLSNMDIVRLNNARVGDERLRELVRVMAVGNDTLLIDDLHAAFELYYQRELNSGTLEAFGVLLERLVAGEYLSAEHTSLMLDHMENITTGSRRIQAGLPRGTSFAQKTGTQIARACNVGVINARSPDDAVVVSACVEKYDDQAAAEGALRRLGEALAEVGLVH